MGVKAQLQYANVGAKTRSVERSKSEYGFGRWRKFVIKRFKALLICLVFVVGAMMPLTGCSSETYTPADKTPTVSVPTIGKEGVLRVGVDANSSPYAGTSSSGIVGINVDIAAAIADELGLKLEVVDYGTDPDSALVAGTVDIVLGIDKANTKVTFWVSDAYIFNGVALFSSNEAAPLPTDSSYKIAAQASSMSAWEVNQQFGEESLISSSELKNAFNDLANGTVDYVAADAVIGTFSARQNDIDAHIIGMMQTSSGYGIGVADTNTDLKQLISDTLVKLQSNGIIDLIEIKWLGADIDLSTLPKTESGVPSGEATSEEEASTEEAVTEDQTEVEDQATPTEDLNPNPGVQPTPEIPPVTQDQLDT